MLEVPELLARINAEDQTVSLAVARELPYVARAVELIVASFKAGGRLVYVGAGTSGRLGVLDASECPPTFGSDPDMVVGVIAGGYTAVVRAVEGAEDRADQGAHAMDDLEVGPEDTVVGLAASRRTPYVVSAIARARSLGARTVYVTCTPREEFTLDVDVAICPVVGPEVLMGSTRMKAGTAQKLVCNMLSTASFVRIGKAYENMMVDLLANSQKLVERGRRAPCHRGARACGASTAARRSHPPPCTGPSRGACRAGRPRRRSSRRARPPRASPACARPGAGTGRAPARRGSRARASRRARRPGGAAGGRAGRGSPPRSAGRAAPPPPPASSPRTRSPAAPPASAGRRRARPRRGGATGVAPTRARAAGGSGSAASGEGGQAP